MGIVHVIQESVRECRSVAFDAHAVRRMQERSVSEDDVLDVLRQPDETDLRAHPGRVYFRKQFGTDKIVDVIFEEDPTQIVVISMIRK